MDNDCKALPATDEARAKVTKLIGDLAESGRSAFYEVPTWPGARPRYRQPGRRSLRDPGARQGFAGRQLPARPEGDLALVPLAVSQNAPAGLENQAERVVEVERRLQAVPAAFLKPIRVT